ncbi:aminoglycoside phosphotransferase family protein (plasmid) [Cytobacillus spongiae]|uniref:aminoglycoside phosphotransferase family protein n=1 Tax=Cytobacillus spongiae TaxID=2901381 RepID=UPI001F2A4EC7|nr:aminoglycoside phosphotransferase family protein [Cytobacillus spongiae]UII58390.1 aminoglycoside phosphotransferase family protein [Cytobacillus spongiae]
MINEELRDAILKLNIENSAMEHITKIGEGAWHNVYKIERKHGGDLVLRIRKKNSYGQLQEYHEIDLITEYESSKVYYHQANRSSFNICPLFFDYFYEESLVFTIESYMGNGKKLQYLSHSEGFAIGEKLGEFFKDMHEKIPEIKGFGNIIWNGKQLEGNIQQETNLIWQNDNDNYLNVLNELTTTDLKVDRKRVVDKVINIIDKRRKFPQKISLVNQDVTPENIIFNLEDTSLIDPYPRLDFDLKYAGYFVFCYKFLIPAYSNAPRYQKHTYAHNSKIMSRIADGFMKGYTKNKEKLYHRLMEEYVLWVLLETHEHYETLNKSELPPKTLQQMGDKDMIKNRLSLCLRELEKSMLFLN